jgi:radical SAM superfamily enzyme YgiQ (UPF0313 family)
LNSPWKERSFSRLPSSESGRHREDTGIKDRPGVLLVQPPIYDFALYDLYLHPYGLDRLAAWFSRGGYRTVSVDALNWRDPQSASVLGPVKRRADGTGKFFRQPADLPSGVQPIPRRYSRYGILKEVFAQRISKAAPEADLVCITTGMTYWYEGAAEAADLVRSAAPKVPIVLGGIYAALMPDHARAVTQADLVETEGSLETLKKFLHRRRLPLPPGPVPPYPDARQLLRPGQSAGVLRLNQGCPMNCSYCASRLIDPVFKPGAPREAFAYVQDLYQLFGTSRFAFYDDALLVDKERVLVPFLKEVIRSGLDLSFCTPNAVHIRHMDGETARLMKKAGFSEVRMGFESSSATFHEAQDRKFTLEEFSRTLTVLREAGFTRSELPVYILAGLPGQQAEEVEHSIREAAAAGASVSIAEYSPVPGTLMWNEAVKTSPLPLEEQPLYHNNSYCAAEWSGQTREDVQRLKLLARRTRETE